MDDIIKMYWQYQQAAKMRGEYDVAKYYKSIACSLQWRLKRLKEGSNGGCVPIMTRFPPRAALGFFFLLSDFVISSAD